MNNISGFGSQITLKASTTFPVGINLTQFSHEGDPFDIPSLQIADGAMGTNGDLVVWTKAVPIKLTLSMIPKSDDDINLGILLAANTAAQGKRLARDKITLTLSYPDGTFITLAQGAITDGMPMDSLASAGNLKAKTYGFMFQSVSGNII